MTDAGPVDLLRILIAAGAFWLGILVTRLGWQQWRARNVPNDSDKPHWATYASFAIALFAIAVYRIERIGTPADSRTWVTTAIVALGMYGVLKRVRPAVQRRTDRR